MLFKNCVTAFYGRKIYSETQQLKCQKVKFTIAFTKVYQFILIERCTANNIMPKSFYIKSPILSKRAKT